MITREAGTAWVSSLSACLTQRRVLAHAVILVLCLWGVCAVDFAIPGTFDRTGNIKFQDFLSFYISGKLIAQGRASDLYNEPLRHAEMLAIACPIDVARETVFPPTAHTPTNVRIPNLYGPQVALVFVPLARLPFLIAAQIWAVLTVLIYFVCVYAIWRCCPNLLPHGKMTALAAIAFPPLFHVFVRGQLSALVLACLTVAFLALQADRLWLAGFALGFLFLKPQFLVAIPLVLLLAHAWKILIGVILSAGAQLSFARVYFGPNVVHAYFDMLRHSSRWIDTAEGSLAPIQMHSLRSFFSLLIPSPAIAFTIYLLSSICVIWLASRVWKSQSSVALRFSALTLAAVLVNPHLFIYDLLVLAPSILLLTDWSLKNPQHPAKPVLDVLLYLSFLLPLFGPLAHWTHLQLSVIAFAALLWTLRRLQISEMPLTS